MNKNLEENIDQEGKKWLTFFNAWCGFNTKSSHKQYVKYLVGYTFDQRLGVFTN